MTTATQTARPASTQGGVMQQRKVLQRLGRLALAATCAAAIVVLLGAWTRLSDAGLGCPDWPGCYGFLHVPSTADHVALAELRFPDAPVEIEKGWPEMIHRYFAGALGLLIFAMAGYAVYHRQQATPWKHALLLAGLVLLQAAFGMWTVTLKLWPQVVAAHLLGGFATLTLLALLSFRLLARPLKVDAQTRQQLARFKPALSMAVLLVILQIALGAWTAANYAAVACPDLPTCQGKLWPDMDFRHGFDLAQHIGPNYLGGQLNNAGRIAIHVTHRLGAILVLVLVASVLWRLWRHCSNTRLAQGVLLAGSILLLQVTLGLANVLYLFPLPIAVAHNATGAALLISLVYLTWRVFSLRLNRYP